MYPKNISQIEKTATLFSAIEQTDLLQFGLLAIIALYLLVGSACLLAV